MRWVSPHPNQTRTATAILRTVAALSLAGGLVAYAPRAQAQAGDAGVAPAQTPPVTAPTQSPAVAPTDPAATTAPVAPPAPDPAATPAPPVALTRTPSADDEDEDDDDEGTPSFGPSFGRPYEARALAVRPGELARPVRDHRPRWMLSVGYAFGAGGHAGTGGLLAAGLDASVGVQIDPVLSVQLQGMFGFGPGVFFARGALVAGFAPIPELSIGVGGSLNYTALSFGQPGYAIGLPVDFSFCLGPDPAEGERRHGILVSVRIDPGVGVAPFAVGPAFYAYLIVGYITR